MEQIQVKIGEVEVPLVIDGGEEWYPVRYIYEKVLLRKGEVNIDKNLIKKLEVDFSQSGGGIQETNCINRNNLLITIKKTRVGRLSVDQRKAQNGLHEYLGIDLLIEDERDVKIYNEEWLSELDEYTQDVVKEVLMGSVDWFRMCSKCNKHFPLDSRFYAIDNRAVKGFSKICRICSGNREYFTHPNEEKNYTRRVGNELFIDVTRGNVIQVFDMYVKRELKRLPDKFENKKSYKEYLFHLYNKGIINVNNLTLKFLKNELKLSKINKYFNITEIYQLLFGKEYYLYCWKYPKHTFSDIKLTFGIANKVVKNYLKENNVIINDIFSYDYEGLFRACKINKFTSKDILQFIVQLYEHKYAGYKFKTKSVNYYHNETNLLFDLKYLIEKDMRIHEDRIPLYLTKNNLQRYCRPLYQFIVTNRNGSIFEWVDKIYPNKYCREDFEVNPYRNEFDSDTEMFIHDILVEEFGGNVIYNQRNNTETVKLKNKVPDWFLFTDNGVWLVEYFGMFEKRYIENNRIVDYKNKMDDKLKTYQTLDGYRFLYIYREDIVNNYAGVREKIKKVKETLVDQG